MVRGAGVSGRRAESVPAAMAWRVPRQAARHAMAHEARAKESAGKPGAMGAEVAGIPAWIQPKTRVRPG